MIKITAYHATDIPSTKREYNFTTKQPPRDTVDAREVEVSRE